MKIDNFIINCAKLKRVLYTNLISPKRKCDEKEIFLIFILRSCRNIFRKVVFTSQDV